MRIIGPNCLGVMSPLTGLNATFAAGMARPGNVGFISQSGALLHGDPRLEPPREGRLQRLRLDRLDAGRGLGRPHRLPGQRPAHQEHRHLHGVHRRRARVPFGRARGGPDQADHRDQGRAARAQAAKAAASHTGSPDRQRRGAGRRVSARAACCGSTHRRSLRHGRGPGQAAAPHGARV